MALQVIGAGYGRTGTLSLKFALEQLGFDQCYHMMEVMKHPEHSQLWSAAHGSGDVDWDAFMSGYQASVDWPSCNLWRQQLAHWPEAKILLSLRDPDDWYDSVMATIYKSTVDGLAHEDPARRAHAQWVSSIIWDPIFNGRMDDRAHAIGCFNRHNETVQEEVPADKLLVYRPGDGWEPLCAFLGVDIPDTDYPRVNSRDDFAKMWKREE